LKFDFTQHLYDHYRTHNISLTVTDTVTVTELDYLRHASELIERESSHIVQNYLLWRLVMRYGQLLPRTIRNARHRFDQQFRGVKVESSRSIICAKFVNENMGMVVSKLYLEKYFDRTARNEVMSKCNSELNCVSSYCLSMILFLFLVC
jgi:predicted metalloendopeptidase